MFDDPTPESTAHAVRRVARRAAPVLAALSIAVVAPLATSELVVERGQTLSGIAQDHQLAVSRLAAFNGISDPNVIFEGQVLRIPPPTGEEFAYEVAPGDTLGGLAVRFDTTTEAIAKRNDLSDVDRIVAGKSLVIPARSDAPAEPDPEPVTPPKVEEPTAEPAAEPAPTTTAAPAPTTTAAPAPTTTAAPAPTTTAAPATTTAPTTTVAPPTTAAPTTTAAPATTAAPTTTVAPANPGVVVSTIWVVQPGDTISSVAARFGLSPASLASANRVGVDAALTPGQYLFIPQN